MASVSSVVVIWVPRGHTAVPKAQRSARLLSCIQVTNSNCIELRNHNADRCLDRLRPARPRLSRRGWNEGPSTALEGEAHHGVRGGLRAMAGQGDRNPR